MTRFVDTQIAHIPIRGPGVPAESLFTLPETSWMPYMWSINNVVMAEVAHTSLAYWQAGRADAAFPVFKGCLLDSMFLGLCPGNVGAMTYFDMARGEAQRDFADGCGATSRALVEGLFGVQPDALAGELKIRPGFPAQWNHASIKHPDLNFAFQREGSTETFSVEQTFSRPLALGLRIPALLDGIASVTVNGQPAKWRMVGDCAGWPRIEIESAAAARHEVVVRLAGTHTGQCERAGDRDARRNIGSRRLARTHFRRQRSATRLEPDRRREEWLSRESDWRAGPAHGVCAGAAGRVDLVAAGDV